MLLTLIEVVLLDVVRYLGWVALKLVTLGRYRRVRGRDDMLIEGAVGFAVFAAVSLLVSRS